MHYFVCVFIKATIKVLVRQRDLLSQRFNIHLSLLIFLLLF